MVATQETLVAEQVLMAVEYQMIIEVWKNRNEMNEWMQARKRQTINCCYLLFSECHLTVVFALCEYSNGKYMILKYLQLIRNIGDVVKPRPAHNSLSNCELSRLVGTAHWSAINGNWWQAPPDKIWSPNSYDSCFFFLSFLRASIEGCKRIIADTSQTYRTISQFITCLSHSWI